MQSPSGTLVGRDPEIRELASALAADRAIAVVGEAGIGKTSLVRAAAAHAGVELFEGGGFATLLDSPYLALRRALGLSLAGDEVAVASIVEGRLGPETLFVDDLQWVDQSTRSVLRLLHGRSGLVVAIRSGDPGTPAALELAAELGFERFELAGLGAEAAIAIVERLRPRLSEHDARRIVGMAGGNPLLLEEIAVHGQPTGTTRRSIGAGIHGLTPPARRLAEVLAIADRPVAMERAGPAVQELLDARVVVQRAGHVEIRHALIAEAVREAIDPARQAERHSDAAGVLSEPLVVARHLLLAGRPAEAAAGAAAALLADVDLATRAGLLVVLAEAAPPDAGLRPWLTAAEVASAISDWAGVVTLLDPTGRTGSLEEEVDRDVLLGHALFSLGRHDEARETLARAGRAAVDPASQAAARVAVERAAFRVNVDGELGEAIADLRTAQNHVAPGSPGWFRVRAIAESMKVMATLPADIAFLRLAIEASVAGQAFAVAADLARVVNVALLIWEGAEAALAFDDELAPRLAEAGAVSSALELRAETVQALILAGRPREAVTRADELLEQPAPLRAAHTAIMYRARALGLLGSLDAAAASLVELEPVVSSDFVGRGILLASQAELALWGGQVDRVVALADAVARIPSPINGAYTPSEIIRAWAQVDAGRPPTPVIGTIDAPTQAGAPLEAEGLQRLHRGDPSAADWFGQAAAAWAGFNAPRAVFCRWAEGEALRRSGDLAAMEERLTAALEAATASDFEVIAVRIRRSMRRAGLRLPAAERDRVAPRAGLTRRERELLALVAQGLTNAEIARRMGLGRPTVARILSNAMVKLGASSRTQAVSLAASMV
jgi:DNA-binding CsgD family transcriptional regulator/tetratricopeptide (TPR) repeat protein